MRLFVAVWPPAPTIEQLARIERPVREGLRWTTQPQWHVTLRFFGEVADAGVVDDVLQKLSLDGAVGAQVGPRTTRLGSSILCVPVAGLDPLAALVASATAGIGMPPPGRPFRGHITLARAKQGFDIRPLAGVPMSSRWPVDRLTLVASTLDPHGARYEVVSGYAVGGQTGANVAW